MVGRGDTWLATWLPRVLVSPDYRSGRPVVIVTWDEGSASSNLIPTIVVSPTTSHRRVDQSFTTCSVLRTTEDLLGLFPLGCAAGAASMVAPFGL